jgi:hypothetical protein
MSRILIRALNTQGTASTSMSVMSRGGQWRSAAMHAGEGAAVSVLSYLEAVGRDGGDVQRCSRIGHDWQQLDGHLDLGGRPRRDRHILRQSLRNSVGSRLAKVYVCFVMTHKVTRRFLAQRPICATAGHLRRTARSPGKTDRTQPMCQCTACGK